MRRRVRRSAPRDGTERAERRETKRGERGRDSRFGRPIVDRHVSRAVLVVVEALLENAGVDQRASNGAFEQLEYLAIDARAATRVGGEEVHGGGAPR